MSFVADLRDAIHGFHFADRRQSQLPTLQAAQVTITEPDSAVSAFEASSATLLKVCRVGPKPGDLTIYDHNYIWLTSQRHHQQQHVVCPSWPAWEMPFTASTLQIGGYHSYQHRKLQAAWAGQHYFCLWGVISDSSESMGVDPKPGALRTKKFSNLWYVTSYYISRFTVVLLLHYPMSKAAFILPLPLLPLAFLQKSLAFSKKNH